MQPPPSESFLIDENLPASLASTLQSDGYQAEHIFDIGLRGHSDAEIYQYAQAHQRTIVTNDLDFANIKQYTPPHHGIIVLRLPNALSPVQRNQYVVQALRTLQGQSLKDTLVIVELKRIRVRR